ncbi:hypothetical protein MHU86_20908 [Fragilaria crotonensis]|nr:hypothetical protein MHU86_20908 [Fragilaria crotonensis]
MQRSASPNSTTRRLSLRRKRSSKEEDPNSTSSSLSTKQTIDPLSWRGPCSFVDMKTSTKEEDPNSSTSSSSPSSLAINKTDNQPAILAGTVQLSSTRRDAAKRKIQPALCPHLHRPSQSTKQTINPLSWQGPCSYRRQGEMQRTGRSNRHFVLIPTVLHIQLPVE